MTIYTDPVSGLKYDRVYGGMAVGQHQVVGYRPCADCAFNPAAPSAGRRGGCPAANGYCVSENHDKVVFFVFKERKA